MRQAKCYTFWWGLKTPCNPRIRTVTALPVPLSFVGKISGVYEYNTAYMIFDMKLYAQFQPSKDAEFNAVVLHRMKAPVSTVEAASVPLRPKIRVSTR